MDGTDSRSCGNTFSRSSLLSVCVGEGYHRIERAAEAVEMRYNRKIGQMWIPEFRAMTSILQAYVLQLFAKS